MSGVVLAAAGTLIAALGAMLAAGAASVSRLELSRWVAERHGAGSLATALLSAPERILGPTTGLIVLGTVATAVGVSPMLAQAPLAGAAGMLLAGLPVFFAFAHTLPRALGRRWAEPLMRSAGPWLVRSGTVWSLFAPRGTSGPANDLQDDEGGTESGAVGFVAGLIAFTERPVREVMTPRTEIVAAAEGAPLEEVATLVEESGYTRLPVYRESLDDIVGMVHAFDLLKAGDAGALPVRPVTVTPGTRRCADLLVDLQRDRHQFAVVLDEFGGTAGIVTLEDLLEELVGEIFDEYDRRPAVHEPGVELLEIDGTAACAELASRFEVEFPNRAETVGGLLALVLGRIPRLGERIIIADLEFDVLAATSVRVERVVVRRVMEAPS